MSNKNRSSRATDRDRILDYLKSGKPLTGLEAYSIFKTLSLPQHIEALRKRGHEIITNKKYNSATGKYFAEYRLSG